jgi:biopolymer transport protein ExbD
MNPSPTLHFAPDENARYERGYELLAMANRAQVRRMGFIGNDRYANF